jgi:hypothetical protein
LRHPRWPIGDRLGARVGRGTPKPVRAPTLGMSANPAPEKIPGCLYPSSRLAPQRRVRIRVDKLRARGVVVREGEADIAIVIEKARAANSLRALTGEERNSSRSRRAHDGHRFESPQLHQEVAASRPGFPAPTIPRLFSGLARKLMVCRPHRWVSLSCCRWFALVVVRAANRVCQSQA